MSVVVTGRPTTLSPPGARQTHTVSVAPGGHNFDPDTIEDTNIGDIVEFHFYPKNHSVVRAAYGFPCMPYETANTTGVTGFFSGFRPVDQISENLPTWSVRINDTDPIFYYCSQTESCTGYQMIGVINPNSNVSLETQKEKAKSAYLLQPGEPIPAEVLSATSTQTMTAPTAPPTMTQSSTTSSSSPAAASSSHHALSTGAIVGVAVGGAIVLALVAALSFYIARVKSLKQEVDRTSSTIQRQGLSAMYQQPIWPPSPSPRPETVVSPYSSPASQGHTFEQKVPDFSNHGVHAGDGLHSERGTPRPMPNISAPHILPRGNSNYPRELEAPDSRFQ